MDARVAFRVSIITLVLCGTFFLSGYGIGRKTGREAEREETRTYVNEGMKEAGFCEWIKKSRIVQDCNSAKGGA